MFPPEVQTGAPEGTMVRLGTTDGEADWLGPKLAPGAALGPPIAGWPGLIR
jgi:hypothetical protein